MSRDSEGMIDNRSYYDRFSDGYDRGRRGAYHGFVDRLSADTLRPYMVGKDVLEVGCGTGLMMTKLQRTVGRIRGVDLSPEMAKYASARGFDVTVGPAEALPFDDQSFDASFSVKVMPHVRDLETALAEMHRVTKPGGYVAVDFYNRLSPRYLAKRLGPSQAVAAGVSEQDVFTRWSYPGALQVLLPAGLEVLEVRGIRILTPIAGIHDVPVLGAALERAERRLSTTPLRWLAGFLLVVMRRV